MIPVYHRLCVVSSVRGGFYGWFLSLVVRGCFVRGTKWHGTLWCFQGEGRGGGTVYLGGVSVRKEHVFLLNQHGTQTVFPFVWYVSHEALVYRNRALFSNTTHGIRLPGSGK